MKGSRGFGLYVRRLYLYGAASEIRICGLRRFRLDGFADHHARHIQTRSSLAFCYSFITASARNLFIFLLSFFGGAERMLRMSEVNFYIAMRFSLFMVLSPLRCLCELSLE